VLFDVDGTLVDSNYLHTVAWWQAFRREGLDIEMAAIHRAIGMGGGRLVAHLLGDDAAQQYAERVQQGHSAVFATSWPALRPFSAAAELLGRCSSEGLTVVLASSAGEADLAALRAALGADDAIDAATGSADADESKPSPDILTAALRAGGLSADEAVFVGDSVWDVKAAARAGLRCIGVECGGTSAAELREAGAIEIYADPADLLRRFDESALAPLAGRH
jgi:HAD superfamily hydrolase (TIGR01509 family)